MNVDALGVIYGHQNKRQVSDWRTNQRIEVYKERNTYTMHELAARFMLTPAVLPPAKLPAEHCPQSPDSNLPIICLDPTGSQTRPLQAPLAASNPPLLTVGHRSPPMIASQATGNEAQSHPLNAGPWRCMPVQWGLRLRNTNIPHSAATCRFMLLMYAGPLVYIAISAIIVLGISVDLARGQDPSFSALPAATGYAAFCGGLGVLVSLIGVASLFVSAIQDKVTWALDGLSAVTMLAAGIAYAVLLRNTNCSDEVTIWDNDIISGGCGDLGEYTICRYSDKKLKSRCVSAKADTAFMFISFVACVGVVGYSFFVRRGVAKGVNYA
ncbi:membrane-associating domain-containing protein [Aspergillus californicus]